MSRAGIQAHVDGDCGFSCHYCAIEEDRETQVTLTSDGIEVPLDTDDDDDEDDDEHHEGQGHP